MKCAAALCVLLAGCPVVLAGSPNSSPAPASTLARPSAPRRAALLDDLVAMTRGGESDATVLVYAKAHRMEAPSEVSDADLRWLQSSGVGESVVRYMAAIDVRSSSVRSVPEGVTYVPDGSVNAARVRAALAAGSAADDDSAENGAPSASGREIFTGLASDAQGSFGTYRVDDGYGDGSSGYDAWGYGSSFDAFDVPFFSAPFPAVVFVDRGRFSRRFPHRDFRSGGHRDSRSDRGQPPEAWRERDSRESWRSTSARGFSAAPRGARARAIGPRAFGIPAFARGSRAPHFGRVGSIAAGGPGFRRLATAAGPRSSPRAFRGTGGMRFSGGATRQRP